MSFQHNFLEGLVPAPLAGQEHDADAGEEEADEEEEEGPVSDHGHHITMSRLSRCPHWVSLRSRLLDIDRH